MRVVFLSHTTAGGVFRVGSHHLSRELARRGHQVAHVSTPISVAHAAKAMVDKQVRSRFTEAWSSRVDDDGVLHLVPLSMLPASKTPLALRRFEADLYARVWKRRHSILWMPDVVYLDQPLLESAAHALGPRKVIYRPTDAHFEPAARAAEIRALTRADGIAATSASTLQSVTAGTAWERPSIVIENGVEIDRFHAAERNRASTKVVYLGALDSRFDWPLLARLSHDFPDNEFAIAGPVSEPPAVNLGSNVNLMGPVPYEAAPTLLSDASVGLLPLSDHPGNAGRSPMKYYEYLGSGLAVVAKRAPALAARTSPNVWLYDDADGASEALATALATTDDVRASGVESARENSWAACAERLETFTLRLPAGDAR